MQDSVRRGRLGGSLANGSGLSVDELKAVLSPLAGETDLKYIQVGPMSECIKACLAAQGFRQVPQDSCTDWRLAWGSTLPAARLAVMRATQAHNHIPGWHRLNNKGMLAKMAEQSRARGQRLANHVPRSFVLPAHLPDLLRDSSERGGPYIVKPIGGTRGRGIQVHARLDEGMLRGLSGVVVQRYITDCHLIGDRKYDLRLYVAATSTCPMRLYMHQEGYARFCSEKYDLARLHDLFRHVTNSNFQVRVGTKEYERRNPEPSTLNPDHDQKPEARGLKVDARTTSDLKRYSRNANHVTSSSLHVLLLARSRVGAWGGGEGAGRKLLPAAR